MPTFTYTVRTPAGATQRGRIGTADRRTAALALRQRQLLVTSLRVQPGEPSSSLPGLTGGVVAAALVWAFRWFRGTASGQRLVDTALLKAPVFGSLVEKIVVASFARPLATLVSSGVPILDGLAITVNEVMEDAVLAAIERIRQGSTIAEPLRQTVFAPMVVQMIEVGENTSTLD